MVEVATLPADRRGGLVRVEHIMGMAISLDIADDLPPDTLQRLADGAFDWLCEVDARFSTYKVDSEVSRLARGALRRQDCSAEMGFVLDRCAQLWHATDGYFEVYAGGALDPSGFVKGWAVAEASSRLAAAGSRNHCLNAGGDVYARGGPTPHRPWRVGIRHPWQPMSTCWVVNASDIGVATSGTYERGHHVLDPYTGRPARGLCSVTVVGPDLGTADAFATAALAMGRRGIDWLSTLDGYESAVVTDDGEAYQSEGFATT